MTFAPGPASESGVPVGEVFSQALRGQACAMVGTSDEVALPVGQWRRAADDADRALLSHCRGRTLDIGCGPGRMGERLLADGHVVLALDVVEEAVLQARGRGVTALQLDIFSPVPDEGTWDTALLADGNIGIGGDPVALLRRIHRLLAPRGRVVVDLEPPGLGVRTEWTRLRVESGTSQPFPWARVAVDAVGPIADAAGFDVEGIHDHHGRWFAVLGARP